MKKEVGRKLSIWEKVADFLIDISKYVLTAVIMTSAFEELSDNKLTMYVISILGSVIFFSASIFILNLYTRDEN